MNSSPEYRHECLMKYIINLPDDKRKQHYANVLEHHGKAAANALIAAVNEYRKSGLTRSET